MLEYRVSVELVLALGLALHDKTGALKYTMKHQHNESVLYYVSETGGEARRENARHEDARPEIAGLKMTDQIA